MEKEHLSKPLFVKKKLEEARKPRSTPDILREAKVHSKAPKGEPNYWGGDKTVWKKKP